MALDIDSSGRPPGGHDSTETLADAPLIMCGQGQHIASPRLSARHLHPKSFNFAKWKPGESENGLSTPLRVDAIFSSPYDTRSFHLGDGYNQT